MANRGVDNDKDASFENVAVALVAGAGMNFAASAYVPPMSSWAKLKDVPAVWSLKLREFPKELLRALENPGTKDCAAALKFLQWQSGLARHCAFQNGRKDIEAAARHTLAPFTSDIEAGLIRILDAKDEANRLRAASVLLNLKPEHDRAAKILMQSGDGVTGNVRAEVYSVIGLSHLTNKSALAVLMRGLRDKNADVRQGAANGLYFLGTAAREAVPALIALFESGKAAEGALSTAIAIAPLRQGNMALMCLGAIGPDASPAVPVLRKMLAKASEDETCQILECIARIGPAAKECRDAARNSLKSENLRLRCTAACALLVIDPDDEGAASALKASLNGEHIDKRSEPFEIHAEIGPRSRVLLPTLLALLEDNDENTRLYAALAVGRLGPEAAEAIPVLERLLTANTGHGDSLNAAAAAALKSIGKASVPALLRATETGSLGRGHAIDALGHVGQDAGPAVVKRLTSILADKNDLGRWHAVLALGRLGEHARLARRALEACRPDAAEDDFLNRSLPIDLMIDWALSEIPDSGEPSKDAKRPAAAGVSTSCPAF
jgi:HEAT repeat protein